MRESNKSEAFKLVRALNSDGDHEALDDATLEDLWARFRIGELPEPLDAIVLQCFAALPATVAVRLMQVAAYHEPVNGQLDDATMAAVDRMRSVGIEELILLAQAGYVIGRADHEMCGLDLGAGLGRVAMCTRFLEDWAMANRISVPLHAV